MARQQKKRPTKDKRPIELTDDEVMERLYSKEVHDKLKEAAGKADRNGKKSPHR